MKATIFYVVLCIIQLGLVKGDSEVDKKNEVCPLWNYYNHTTNSCHCGADFDGTILCNQHDKTVTIKKFFCMTVDNMSEAVVGACLYTGDIFNKLVPNSIYMNLSTNTTTDLNNVTCGPYNRRGVMCGECIEGHGLPVYSYSLSCVECTHYKYNWIKYIVAAYTPLTVFFIIVVILGVSATSGLMIGCVSITQFGTAHSLIQAYITFSPKWKDSLILYSVWNLDFFRLIYPPFCIHPHFSALQIMSLDYIIAIYPMVAVLITYVIVNLYDRFIVTMQLCRPVFKCLHSFRKEWNVKRSLIGAFATMFLLSYIKILNVSCNILLTFGYLKYMNGSVGKLYVAYDSIIPYLGRTHLPYFILAVIMSFIFNVLPLLLLCLYPCRCFQRCLNRTGLRSQTLHTFVDAFQGCYKHKPYDFRFFSALFLIAHIANMVLFSLTGVLEYHPSASYVLLTVVIILCIARPFKSKWHNAINITFFLVLLAVYLSIVFQFEGIYFHNSGYNRLRNILGYIFMICLNSTQPLYVMILLVQLILPLRIKRLFANNFKVFKNDFEGELEQTLPYRLQPTILQESAPLINS